jgi:nucleotide-binding universal stress UspA family protein
MYQRIAVAVDGSPTANAGLREAVNLAVDQKANLLLIHVVEEPLGMMTPDAGFYIADVFEVMRASGKEIVAKAEAVAKQSGVATQTIMSESFTTTAADHILKEVVKWRADLIVVGTHGRRGLRRLVLGSDAEAIVRGAPVPVLLVRADEGANHEKIYPAHAASSIRSRPGASSAV